MKKEGKLSLSWLQIIVISVLAIMGVFALGSAEPFRVEYDTQKIVELGGSVNFDFLQAGAYTVEVTYVNSPEGNTLYVMSKETPDGKNGMGCFFVDAQFPTGSGVVRETFTLEQGAYNVTIIPKLEMKDGFSLEKVILQSNSLLYKDNYFVGGVLLMAAVALFLCFWKVPAERYKIWLGLVGIGVLATLPLFSGALISGDDLEFHITRLEGIYLGLAAGEFPVRITSQQMAGFGGLTATMYPQLFLYPFAALRFLDVSLMLCYKTMLLAINVGTAFAAYYGTKNICKSGRVAAWSSILYTFSVYRLSNMYMRAALGETLAMLFLPLVLWGTYEILWGKRRWIVLALGMTGLLGSHLISVEISVMFMAVELIYWLISKKKEEFIPRLCDGLKAVAMTVVLNLGFLVPFLYYSREELQCFLLPFELDGSGVYMSQLFSLFPALEGMNLAGGSTNGEMAISLGFVLLVGVGVFVYAFGKEKKLSGNGIVGARCLVYGLGAVLMASWIFPWDKIAQIELLNAVFKNLQFPWRMLAFATLFFCLATAIAVDKLLEEGVQYRWVSGLLAGLLAVTTCYMFDGMTTQRWQIEDKMWLEGRMLADGMYLYSEGDTFEPLQLKYWNWMRTVDTQNGTDVRFVGVNRKGTGFSVEIIPEVGVDEHLIFPVYWYPGYKAEIDGVEVPVERIGNQVGVLIGEDARMVEIRYKGFWFFALADIVSVLGFFGILGFGVYKAGVKRSKGLRSEAE